MSEIKHWHWASPPTCPQYCRVTPTANGLGTGFGQAGVLGDQGSDQGSVFPAEHLIGPPQQQNFKKNGAPGAVGDEVLKAVLIARRDHIGQGHHAFPGRRLAQTLDIERGKTTLRLVLKMRLERPKPSGEVSGPAG